jgi:hypothetical protein
MEELPEEIKALKADAQELLEVSTRRAKVARDLIKAVDAYEAEMKDGE